jgi:hypothetical protein
VLWLLLATLHKLVKAARLVASAFCLAHQVTLLLLRLSSSVAVGKGFSAATSLTSVANQTTATSAVGSGGGFTLSNANSTIATYNTIAETTVVTDQANTFAGGSPASLRPGTGVILP